MCGPLVQVNGEAQKTPEEMYAEVVIAQRVSKLRESSADSQNLTDGFIHLRCAAVAVSEYAPSLLAAWNAWDKIHRSENETPKIFPAHQPYMVFITADGGCDLEHFQVMRVFRRVRVFIVVVKKVGEALGEGPARYRRETVGLGSVERRSKRSLSHPRPRSPHHALRTWCRGESGRHDVRQVQRGLVHNGQWADVMGSSDGN
jgi:hypothetical protein